MAHFAKISEDNIVLTVVAVDDENILNEGVVDEALGQQYLQTHCNWPANLWIQTGHKNENQEDVRKNNASIGGSWDSINNIFWHEKPYPSWVKNIPTASWKSPLGDAPELTEEQVLQNTAGTHKWIYEWDENAYQADNTTGWVLTNIKAII
jgi:hypothetical protein